MLTNVTIVAFSFLLRLELIANKEPHMKNAPMHFQSNKSVSNSVLLLNLVIIISFVV